MAIALAVDCFTVGASLGLRYNNPRQVFRLSFHFGLFQSLLFFAGLLIGGVAQTVIANWDHWIAFIILTVLGSRMIFSSFRKTDKTYANSDLTRGFNLIGFSTAVSIDALVAGVGISAVKVHLLYSVLVVGVVSVLMTVIGIGIANRAARRLGKYSEIIAGIVLILLGLKILTAHLGL